MSKSLVEKVREFDGRLGEDLEVLGYEVMSKRDHLHLRKWLEEAGYAVVRSDSVQPSASYYLDKMNVYSKFQDKKIELFIERNLKTMQSGFSYLTLATMQELKQFEKLYWGAPMGYVVGAVVGGVGAMGFGIIAIAELSLPGLGMCIVSMGGAVGSALGADYNTKKKKELLQKTTPTLTINPREAILRAFHLHKKEQADEKKDVEIIALEDDEVHKGKDAAGKEGKESIPTKWNPEDNL